MTNPLSGLTLLEYRIDDPTVDVSILFISRERVESGGPERAYQFLEEVRFLVRLDGVGEYAGHAIFGNADPIWEPEHLRYASVSGLPGAHSEDYRRIGDCPNGLRELIGELTPEVMVRHPLRVSDHKAELMEVATLKRVDGRLELDEWVDAAGRAAFGGRSKLAKSPLT